MKKTIRSAVHYLGHLAAIVILGGFFWPIAKWYFEKRPLMGTDFFLLKSYVNYLSHFFALRPAGWKYLWSAGYPLASDYPTFHTYLILPLTKFLSQIQSVQVYMLLATFLFGLFAYLLFYEVSKSKGLSALLSVGCFYSVGYYGSLIFGGGLPYYATQTFLPLVLWLIVRHYHRQENEHTRDRKLLVLAGFLTGIAFVAHAQAPLTSIAPLSLIFILFWNSNRVTFFSKSKLVDLSVFLAVAFATGFSFIRNYFTIVVNMFLNLVRTREQVIDTISTDSQYSLEWELSQLSNIWQYVSFIVWVGLILAAVFFLVAVLIGKKIPRRTWLIFLFVLGLGFEYLNLYTFAIRRNPFQGGWYRAFWTYSLIFGGIVAGLWGAGSEVLAKVKKGKQIASIAGILAALAMVAVGLYGGAFNRIFYYRLEHVSNPSSAFPRNINNAGNKADEARLKKELTPGWMDPYDKNHRMFTIDAGHNLGWSSYFELPLVQGYIDPPIPFVGRGYLYLSDTTLAKDEIVKRLGYTETEAQNLARFFIDWSAIRYFEGGYTSGRTTVNPLSSYLNDFVLHDKEVVFQNVLTYHDTAMPKTFIGTTSTHFYEFKPELVSGIMEGNDSPTIAIIGKFAATDNLTRLLGIKGFHSKYVVPVIGPEKIDDWTLADFKKFDSVFLYSYDYDSPVKTWATLTTYVKEGGNLFVDTGGDVKESASVKLPADFGQELAPVFPVKKTNKGFFGKEWQFKAGDSPLAAGVNFDAFGPAELDGDEWGISYAEEDDLSKGSQVILYNGGNIVMAEKTLGKGRVIWSGLNLPYHVEYYKKDAERDFFVRLLNTLVEMKEQPAPVSTVNWVSPQKRIVTLDQGAKGVLFKEYYYDGWKAKIKSGNVSRQVPIYQAGPAYPGYMYVAIPHDWQKEPLTVEFSFRGTPMNWLAEILTWVITLIVFDYVVLNKWLINFLAGKNINRFSRKTVGWWDKEE